MELEVKHLAPYLPYGLSLVYQTTNQIGKVIKENIGIMKSISHNEDETHPTKVSTSQMYNGEHIWMFKPILRPMKNLQYYIEFLNIYFVDFDKNEGTLIKRINENYTRLNELEFLFKNHFDVFGLIDVGLAVDVNSLSANGS